MQNNFDLANIPVSNIAFTTFMTSLQESWEFIQKNKSKFSKVVPIPKELFPKAENPNITHHESHLFSTLVTLDPTKDHLILIADGCGSNGEEYKKNALFPKEIEVPEKFYESISVYSYIQGQIKVVDKIFSPLYMAKAHEEKYSPASYFTGCAMVVFNNWSYAGKVMGLAGNHQGEIFNRAQLFDALINATVNEKTSKEEFDNLDEDKLQYFQKLCASTQAYFEDYFEKYIRKLKEQFPMIENLTFTGGCALNCIFNEKLRNKNIFKNIFVPAWPNDEGVSIGAAIAAFYIKKHKLPYIQNSLNPFLGMKIHYSEDQIKDVFKDYLIEEYTHQKCVELLKEHQVIAWFQGNSECGPRALGHRTILCLPYIKNLKDYLNDNIKFRENFRPYGCSCLIEDQDLYFENAEGLYSPYMSFAPIVKKDKRNELNEIMHIDKTIRIQSVDQSFDKFYDLLCALKQETKNSLVVHTSLNVNKQPILEDINDALKFFKESKITTLCFNEFIIKKS